MNANALVSHAPDALNLRAYCLTLALAHDWPELTFGRQTVQAGSRAWGRFLRQRENAPSDIAAAVLALGGEADEALDTLRQHASELASEAGHPAVEFLPGQVIMAGADPWAKFLRFAPEEQVVDAIAALEPMA